MAITKIDLETINTQMQFDCMLLAQENQTLEAQLKQTTQQLEKLTERFRKLKNYITVLAKHTEIISTQTENLTKQYESLKLHVLDLRSWADELID